MSRLSEVVERLLLFVTALLLIVVTLTATTAQIPSTTSVTNFAAASAKLDEFLLRP